MKVSPIRLFVLSTLAALVSAPVFAEETPWPEVTPDGLHRVTFSELSVVYLAPGAELGAYDRIRLLDPLVRFRRNWEGKEAAMAETRSADVSPETAQIIRERMARELRKVFTAKLESAGYDVVDENARDVLLFRPAIINLKVAVPENAGTADAETAILSAGEMTLFLEAFDSVSGELLGKGMDIRVARENNALTSDFLYIWGAAETEKNRALLDVAFTKWADALIEALDMARSH